MANLKCFGPSISLPAVADLIAGGLTGLRDVERGTDAIRSVAQRGEVYSGPWASQSPDLIVRPAQERTAGAEREIHEPTVTTLLSSHAGDPGRAVGDTSFAGQAKQPTQSSRVSPPPARGPTARVGRHRPDSRSL